VATPAPPISCGGFPGGDSHKSSLRPSASSWARRRGVLPISTSVRCAPGGWPSVAGRAGGRQTYREKLLDPRWQRMRLRVLERAGWTCQLCGATDRTLHVHHGNYARGEPWDTPVEALWSLCDTCHAISQPLLDAAREAVGSMHPAHMHRLVWILRVYVMGKMPRQDGDHLAEVDSCVVYAKELDELLDRTMGWKPGLSLVEALMDADAELSRGGK